MGDDSVYYRIKLADEKVIVVCMQWFDEADYDQKKLLSGKYYDEAEAEREVDKLNLYIYEKLLKFKR